MKGKHLTEDQIQRMIASDPDAPEATDAQLAQARPFTEAFSALAEAMRKNVGGASESGQPKGRRVPAPWTRMSWPGSRPAGLVGRPG